MKHVLESQQFDRELLEKLFTQTDRYKLAFENTTRSAVARETMRQRFVGGILFNLFYEPSTRTRFSFETAAVNLGMHVQTTENAREFSSASKGERLEDSIRVLCGYNPDVIVLRHHEIGGASRAAAVSTVPIINAGDGGGQHPTQALLDLYTIWSERETLDNLTVIIGGDLMHGRTARSLAYLLAKFSKVRIIFVAPPELAIGEDIKEYLKRHDVLFSEAKELGEALPEADIIYWTRIQRERMSNATYTSVNGRYTLGEEQLRLMRKNARLLHPLPRTDEIALNVDSDPRAAYFRQAANGMYVRMALLSWVLEDSLRFKKS